MLTATSGCITDTGALSTFRGEQECGSLSVIRVNPQGSLRDEPPTTLHLLTVKGGSRARYLGSCENRVQADGHLIMGLDVVGQAVTPH